MITCRWAPKPLVTPLATRLSAALRKMFVFFVFIYYTVEIQSTYKYNGWHICLPFTQTMASAAWRLKSNWGSRPQSLGAFGNCRAIILWPLASVCLASLVENLDTRRWNGMSIGNSSLLRLGMLRTKHYTRPRTDTLIRRPSGKGTWDSYRVLVARP